MADNNRFRVDDWVVIKKTNQKGVIASIKDERVTVRIPQADSPYPSYAYVYPEHINRVRAPKQEKETLDDVPDAPF